MSEAETQRKYETIDATLIEEGAVLRLLLDHPKGNILSMKMLGEIEQALAEHRDLPALRLVLLRGTGGHFSFGASVAEHKKELAPKMLSTFHRVVREIAKYPVPIAAVVEGRCLGGALEVVLVCHLLFAASNAIFACPEIKLGVFPPVLAVAGPCRLSASASERLVLTGDEIDAATGSMLGLVTSVIEAGKDAEGAVLEWYRNKLAPLSAFAIRQATLASRDGSALLAALGAPLDAAEKRYVDKLLPSHDANEGIAAFMERRPPQWTNQ